MAIVYKITCIPTGQIYVGWTSKPLENRWERHLRGDKDGYLQRCMKKHGAASFNVACLQAFDHETEAMAEEVRLIEEWKLNICRHPDGIGMNMTDGGEGTIGYVASHAHRMNLSRSMQGKPKSKRHARNIRRAKLGKNNPMYGKKPTEKQIESARKRFLEDNPHKAGERSHRYGKPSHMRGRKHTPEAREKMSRSLRGRKRGPHTEEAKRRLSESTKKYIAEHGHPGKGRKHSAEAREKMRLARLAFVEKQKTAGEPYRHSDETKAKLRAAARRNRASNAYNIEPTDMINIFIDSGK